MLMHLVFVVLLFYYGACGRTRLMSQQRVVPRNVPDDFFCKNDGDKLCSSDHEGYFVCSKWGDVDDYYPCPANMKCTCHLDGPCKADPICTTTPKPYPMYYRAEYLFDGETSIRHYEDDPKARPVTYPIQGIVRQDAKKQRFIQLINKVKDGGKTFEIIIPDRYRRGKFIKYTGDAKKNCKKEILDEFQPFAMDLENYVKNLNKTKKIVRETEDTWEYKIAFNDGVKFVRESWSWTIRQVSYTKQSKPLQSIYFRDGDKDEKGMRYSKTEDVRWTYRRMSSDRLRWSSNERWYDDFFPYRVYWYEPPYFCLTL